MRIFTFARFNLWKIVAGRFLLSGVKTLLFSEEPRIMKRILLGATFVVLLIVAKAQTDTTETKLEGQIDIPTFTLSEIATDADDRSQDMSGLLQASRDVFVSAAGYTFGPARFRVRGYDSENQTVLMNGVPLNNPESGRAYWSGWGGLNDAMRNKDVKTGIVASSDYFGGVGGVTNITIRPSSYRKQFKFSYAAANRSYNQRVMATYATGLNNKGWAFVASGSRRWAQEGYVEGTFYDAWSYFIGIEKKFKGHSFSLTAMAAPNKRGRAGVSVQEAYDLTGNNYYNPYWGYQDGKKRNARVSNYNQPLITFTHYCDISKKTKAQGSLSYWFGRGGSTALDWVEAGDPRPDYYRYLPSFYKDDPAMFQYYTDLWQDEQKRQIQFDHMYFANSKYLFTVKDAEGIEGNTVTGYRSKYIIEDRRNDKSQIMFDWHIISSIKDNITLSGGLDFNWYKGKRYKTVEDLLGGEYWLDIDKYAGGDPFDFPGEAQSDLNNPNNIVHVGDVFGYSYTANINTYSGFGQAEFTYRKVDFFVGLNLSHTTFWRTGHMRNGHFPDNSYGDSPKQKFFNYGLKGGATYKINGRNYITANGMYGTRAPYFWNSYVSARTREYVVPNLTNETIYSGDISYILRTPAVKGRLTFYYTKFKDQAWSRSFYHDVLRTFINYNMTGVDKQNMGVELGIEANVTPTVTLTGVFGTGQYIYTSRPVAIITRDNDAKIMDDNRKVYFKNYFVGGMPQTVGALGVKYNSPKYWFIGINGNYFGNAYIEPNPDRRTEEASGRYSADDIRFEQLLSQEELPSAFTMDLFGGKSWRIKYKYYVGFTLSLSNVLNNTSYASSGFEQLRYNPNDIEKFPPKYFYLYGRNFFLNIYFRM